MTNVPPSTSSTVPSGHLSAFPSYIPAIICYDSEYAAKSVLGVYNGPKNKQLIAHIRRIYSEVRTENTELQILCSRVLNFSGALHDFLLFYTYVRTQVTSQRQVSFVHVKGHSGDRWNDRADQLAVLGGTGKSRCGIYREGAQPPSDSNQSTSTAPVQSGPAHPGGGTTVGSLESIRGEAIFTDEVVTGKILGSSLTTGLLAKRTAEWMQGNQREFEDDVSPNGSGGGIPSVVNAGPERRCRDGNSSWGRLDTWAVVTERERRGGTQSGFGDLGQEGVSPQVRRRLT